MKLPLAAIFILFICIWALSLRAQTPVPANPTVASPFGGVSVSDPAYPFPPEDKAKIRDFQYESDQLEIRNQKLLLEIEQNKTKQAQLLNQQRLIALDFATKRKINLDVYELDLAQVRMVAKKK